MYSKKYYPSIGIVGGTGPEATIDVQKKLFFVMQNKLSPYRDQDYYRVIVDNDPNLIDRSDAIINHKEEIIDYYVRKIKNFEKSGVDIVLIACNTAHAFLKKIKENTTIVIVDVIAETADYIAKNNTIENIGLLASLGTFKSEIYKEKFSQYNIKVLNLPKSKIHIIHNAIYGIKGGISDRNNSVIQVKKFYNNIYGLKEYALHPIYYISDVLMYIKSKNITHVILGCTELPLILDDLKYNGLTLYDPMLIASNKTVQYCKELHEGKTPCILY